MRKPNDDVLVNFKVPPDMKKQLEKRAGDLDLTVSAVLRRLVRNYLNGQSRQDSPANTGGSGERLKPAA